MTTLPDHIKKRFYKTINEDYSIDDFEKWLYSDLELERLLSPDDYLDLISLSFKKSGAKYELWNLLRKNIDIGEFETFKILELLNIAKQKSERQPLAIMEFYDLYCKGYSFLRNLGLSYGLSLEVPRVKNTTADSWYELEENEQRKLLNSLSPGLEIEIDKVKNWIETKRIILTGERDEMGYYEYIDIRTENEQKQ